MKIKKWKLITVLLAVLTLVTAVTMTVYAYFSTRVYVYTNDGEKEHAHLGMSLQLLFDRLDEDLADDEEKFILNIPYYKTDDATGYNVYAQNPTFDPTAEWGSPQNPYVISNERHLQNLSALQSIGYFDMMYISKNFNENDGTYNGGISMPYFLVSTNQGKPVVIDATDIGEITPIGSAEHPFIGVIGGVSADTPITVGNTDKTTTVSTFHNVKVQTTTDQIDVGLFGYVGYLGNEPKDGEPELYADGSVTTFEGAPAIIQNMLLSDVQIKVHEPSIPEKVSALIGHVFNDHRFSYSGISNLTNVSCENHHIGILAGHISYAKVEYISVYYSDGDICAIDLLHTKNNKNNVDGTAAIPNYLSTTGIVGFMHNMNSPIINQSDANGTVINGNCLVSFGGTSSSGITLNPGGVGTGGGLEIGLGRGYLMARTLYEGCRYIAANQAMGDRVWRYLSNNGWNYAMMFFQNPDRATYVDQNGNPVTIANGVATLNGVGYSKYIVRNISSGDGSAADPYVYEYKLYDGTTLDEKNCQELSQKVWQFAFEKPVTTWLEAVMVYETGISGEYTLADGTSVEIAEEPSADGTYSATITGTNVYYNSDEEVSISCVLFYRRGSNGNYVCSTTPTGEISAPYAYREKPLQIAYAKTMYGTDLCIESTEGLTLINGGEGNFYFYDGVFTFALSSSKDTIEPTWENDTPDTIVLGDNDPNKWETSPYKDNYAVVAFLRKITTVAELEEANGKDIFIGYYQPASADTWMNGSLSVMSLTQSDTSGNWWEGDDRYTTEANAKKFLTSEEYNKLIEALEDDPVENSEILGKINDPNQEIQVLNLESAEDLAELQNYFKIRPTYNNGAFTFSTPDGQNTLGLLRRRSLWMFNTYSIWSRKQNTFPEDASDTVSYYFENIATVVTGTTDGTFRISYTNNGKIRYVNYSTSGFNGVEDPGNTSNLCFYVIEKMALTPIGAVNYAPKSDATNLSFSADQYILWPKAVMDQGGTWVTPDTEESFPPDYDAARDYHRSSTNGYYNAQAIKTDDNANTNNVYKTYKLVNLESLLVGKAGWQNGSGRDLSKTDLSKKFTMQNAMNFAVSLKIPNVPNIQVNNNTVLAPVGPGGAVANIPTGSIAFRINKEGESTIRVIVSVPVSRVYEGSGALATNVDYYLGLWKTEDLTDDGWSLTSFSQTTAEQKFELPRSNPYAPETTAASSDYILVEYGGTTYRCYLNGDRILVGYEFTVQEAGTYILGTAAGSAPVLGIFGEDTTVNYPMEIVYCSADGTASPGRDGTVTSIYGSIDYVYDHNNAIIRVQDYGDNTIIPSKTSDEYYNYYFNSHIITYTDNDAVGFPNINNFQAYVRRKIDSGQIVIDLSVKSPENAQTVPFLYKASGVDADTINFEVGIRPTT